MQRFYAYITVSSENRGKKSSSCIALSFIYQHLDLPLDLHALVERCCITFVISHSQRILLLWSIDIKNKILALRSVAVSCGQFPHGENTGFESL